MPSLPKPKKVESSEPKLGPVTITRGGPTNDSKLRMAILLWGPAAAGKTTFAATAPGEKLWITVGDQEHASVIGRDDVRIADWSTLSIEDFWKHAASDNPFGLDQLLESDKSIETVVFDSLTAATYRALQKAVIVDKLGAGRDFTPTMQQPGIAAYGGRNALMLQLTNGLLRVTGKHGVHVILTAHEDEPTMKKNDRGMATDIVEMITIMLGGKLVGNMSYRLSEIWLLSNSNNRRSLAVWPNRMRRPMKTRMFANTLMVNGAQVKEFPLMYDADLPDEGQAHTIAKWYDDWMDNNGQRIPIPFDVKPEEE